MKLHRFLNMWVWVSVVGLLALGAAPASAQPRGGPMGGPMGGMGGGDMMVPGISSTDLERYAKFLSLTPEQTEASKALLEGYQSEFERAAKTMREASDAAREEFRETRDVGVWQDLRPKMEAFRAQRDRLEQSLMGDVKTLLSPEQGERWPRIERMRRRDGTLRRGFMSGESVDVARLVEEAKVSPEALAALEPVIEQYEAELDKALQERNQIYEDAMNQGMGLWRQGDMQGMQALLEKGREAAIKVRDINRRYARQAQGLLPEDAKPAFDAAFRERSFPRVYRQSYAARALDLAKAFEDLTPEQRTGLDDLRQSHARDAAVANQKWAAAIEENERSQTIADMMGMGGGNDGVRSARTARRDLDERALEKLRQLLTPEQVKRLPDRRGRDEEEGGGPR